MGQPLLLADDILSITSYPFLGWNGLTAAGLIDQTGGAGPVGNEAYRVADGRRSANDNWLGPANADGFITAVCYGLPAGSATPALLPRTVSALVLDRGHNLAGFTVNLIASQDNFTTNQTVFSGVIPLVPGGRPQDPLGAVTEEGAWMLKLPTPITAAYWKFDVPAMGVGLSAQIVGLKMGLHYEPLALYRPFDEHSSVLQASEVVSPLLWRGRGTRGFAQAGVLNVRANDEYDYELCRFTLEELYGSGRTMWIVPDQDRASEAFQAIRPLGQQGFGRPANWAFPTASLQYIEHEPSPIT